MGEKWRHRESQWFANYAVHLAKPNKKIFLMPKLINNWINTQVPTKGWISSPIQRQGQRLRITYLITREATGRNWNCLKGRHRDQEKDGHEQNAGIAEFGWVVGSRKEQEDGEGKKPEDRSGSESQKTKTFQEKSIIYNVNFCQRERWVEGYWKLWDNNARLLYWPLKGAYMSGTVLSTL